MCLPLSVACLFLLSVPIVSSLLDITVLTYGISKASNNGNSVAYIAPAVQRGVMELQLLNGFNATHVVLTNPSILTCEDELAHADMVSRFYYSLKWDRTKLFVIIFSGCDSSVTLSRISREWNALIITSGATSPEIRDKTLHPTAIAMTAIGHKIYLDALLAMFKKHNWSTIAFIYDFSETTQPFNILLMKEIQAYTVGSTGNFSITTFPVVVGGAKINYASLLEQASRVSRVILLGFHASHNRMFMITASNLGFADHNFVYLALEPYPSLRRFGNLARQFNDSFDQIALNAYQQMFQVGICNRDHNPRMSGILQDIKNNGIRDYNASFMSAEQPSEFAVMSYFSVKIFGKVLDETLLSYKPVQDAASMVQRFRNRTFQFDVGSVYLDSTATRLPDYCFKKLSLKTMRFEDVFNYNPSLNIISIVDNASVTWNTPSGKAPQNIPVCGFSGVDGPCSKGLEVPWIPILVGLLLAGVTLGVTVLFISERMASVRDEWWRIELDDLPQNLEKTLSIENQYIVDFRGSAVMINRIKVKNKFSPNKASMTALSEIKRLSHNNIVRLVGLCATTDNLIIVQELCEKGSLANALDRLQLDWRDCTSLVGDLIEGLLFIRSSPFERHGYINPATVFVNKRLTLQIAEVGFFSALKGAELDAETEAEKISRDYQMSFLAPELRTISQHVQRFYLVTIFAKPESDIYSLGSVIMFIREHRAGSLYSADTDSILKLAHACLAETPKERPSIREVKQIFRENFSNSGSGIAQKMMQRLSNYASNLETAVMQRTNALMEERKLCQELLMEMLPSVIVIQLLSGITVDAETFEEVTVLFSYMFGFLDFVARFTDQPSQVMTFLNQVFVAFDGLLLSRDVYKVETISDTYMAVSGLPVPNGNRHASEVCELSLQLRNRFNSIAQSQKLELKITIGINTGACAAGIVGKKRPRYCLFGDTVNIASRLASHGAPSEIHIGGTTAVLIKDHGKLATVSRGTVYLKGKGNEETFWLTEKFKST